jgi:hypothetical protein
MNVEETMILVTIEILPEDWAPSDFMHVVDSGS